MDPTFRNLADLIGTQAEAARILGVNVFRAHRLYHGAPHTVDEIKRIGELMAVAIPTHRTATTVQPGKSDQVA
jgi:hypothetical protein